MARKPRICCYCLGPVHDLAGPRDVLCRFGAIQVGPVSGDALPADAVYGEYIERIVDLVSVVAVTALGGRGLSVASDSFGARLGVQTIGVLVTLAWSGVITYLIVKITAALTGRIRVDLEDEWTGLDLAVHGERAYDL